MCAIKISMSDEGEVLLLQNVIVYKKGSTAART